MKEATNVGQENFEFYLLKFMEKEKSLTVEGKQKRDYAIKFGDFHKYLEENGHVDIQLYQNNEKQKPEDSKHMEK